MTVALSPRGARLARSALLRGFRTCQLGVLEVGARCPVRLGGRRPGDLRRRGAHRESRAAFNSWVHYRRLERVMSMALDRNFNAATVALHAWRASTRLLLLLGDCME